MVSNNRFGPVHGLTGGLDRSARMALRASAFVLMLLSAGAVLPGGHAYGEEAPQQLAQAAPTVPKIFVFAKASPLQVSDRADLSDNHPQEFEFAKAYEATEGSAGYLKVNLGGDKYVYVRSTYVTTMNSPLWLASTSGYNRPDRAKVQFWESANRLNDFISGTNRGGSQYDYEEFFDAAPTFQLRLPIVEKDFVDLLNRQIKMVSVMLPISRQMSQAFDAAKSSAERPLDLDFVVDVSGSTNGFLERTVGGIAKAIGRNESLRKRIRSAVATTFGATKTNRSAFLGKVSLSEIEKVVWHPPGIDQTTDGDREPLVDGLVMLKDSLKADDAAAQVVIVLSGADVELATTSSSLPMPISKFELSLHNQPAAIVAQVTPEPGNDLKTASDQLRGIPRVRYFGYSDTMADDIVSELIRIGDSQKSTAVNLKDFAPVVAAGNDRRMMTFLPRNLTPTSTLPARQPFAAQADWYTIRLWLTVDDLVWKETAQ